jgi:hypothetical protein
MEHGGYNITMNIYLDIDGVLLVSENHAALFADEFISAVVNKFPDSTYWLTTHCWNGENRAKEVLGPYLKPETIALFDKIKPTVWNELKTDGIDFETDFLWFDDDLWPEELKTLEKNNATNRCVLVNLNTDPEMLKKLIEVINEL